MRIKLLIMLPVLVLAFTSCKKKIWGCMDETALNYSSVATEDAKDCIYKESEEVVVSNTLNNIVWENQGTYWSYTISWPSITQEVINNGAVSTFIGDGTGTWTQLPYIVYWTGYFSTVSASYDVGSIELVWEDSDGVLPDTPLLNSVKTVIFK